MFSLCVVGVERGRLIEKYCGYFLATSLLQKRETQIARLEIINMQEQEDSIIGSHTFGVTVRVLPSETESVKHSSILS